MVFDKREEPRRYNDYFYEKQFALIDDKGQNECDKIKKLLDFFIEQLHNSLAIADGKGVFVRVSRSWEKEHGVSAKDVIGIHAYELEQQGVFRPSVTLAVMEKKCRIEMLQYNKNGAKILVSGIPIFNNRGGIDWIVSYSSWDVSNSKGLKEKYDELMVMMKRYSTEIEELRKRGMKIPGIISKSPQMESILDLISRIASEDINVLITGETGVGKNLIARNIHRVSKRNEGPFIEINCGAIPENLIESELFGYEKGAFTGARQDGKIGLIELAHNGTLFLDEIAELPLNLQVKLLKTLQDKTIVRVGGTESMEIDFRLITATNYDLKRLVDEKRFRSDLYFRISVIPINIPPLKDREEDLIELIGYLSNQINDKYNVKKILSEEAISILLNYSWPGNVRELENILEQIIVSTKEDYITAKHIPDHILLSPNINHQTYTNLKDAMEHYEKRLIMNAYNKYKTTVGVGQALGISQPTAARKIKKYLRDM